MSGTKVVELPNGVRQYVKDVIVFLIGGKKGKSGAFTLPKVFMDNEAVPVGVKMHGTFTKMAPGMFNIVFIDGRSQYGTNDNTAGKKGD